jgi:hypothetical protein
MDDKLRMRDPRRRRAAIGVIVLVLHALLALAWLGTIVRQRSVGEPPRVSVRLLPAPLPVELPRSPRAAAVRPPVSARLPASKRPRPAARTVEPSEHPSVPVEAATVAAEAASAPPPAHDSNLLDTEASRRAIHSAARNPNLASRINEQVGVRSPTAAQRLPGNVQQAAKGDCMKGEYPGGGMSLLSLPFLAAALATGNCAQ